MKKSLSRIELAASGLTNITNTKELNVSIVAWPTSIAFQTSVYIFSHFVFIIS